MKFNWGVGITIFIVAFITFILSFVFRASQINTDLTSEDYYEQEINYQPTIDAKNNAVNLKTKFEFGQHDNFYLVRFPAEHYIIEKGNLHFYRPENADLDKNFDITLSNSGEMAIPLTSLTKGGYRLGVHWTKDGKDYFFEKEITIE
ncbi:MAG: FixH family protein [Flavobacteriales bacterium]|nr:FixH family protein [Flavobacteriales bacterium]